MEGTTKFGWQNLTFGKRASVQRKENSELLNFKIKSPEKQSIQQIQLFQTVRGRVPLSVKLHFSNSSPKSYFIQKLFMQMFQ